MLESDQYPLSVALVARQLFCNLASVHTVLNGRRIGTVTWRKLKAVLSGEQWDCARAFAAENLSADWLDANYHFIDGLTILRGESLARAALLESVRGYITRDEDKFVLPETKEHFEDWCDHGKTTPLRFT